LIPIRFGYGDGDEFLMRGWVWDSETRPRPVTIPKYHVLKNILKIIQFKMRVI